MIISIVQWLSCLPPVHKMQADFFLADRQQLSGVRDLIQQPENSSQFKRDRSEH